MRWNSSASFVKSLTINLNCLSVNFFLNFFCSSPNQKIRWFIHRTNAASRHFSFDSSSLIFFLIHSTVPLILKWWRFNFDSFSDVFNFFLNVNWEKWFRWGGAQRYSIWFKSPNFDIFFMNSSFHLTDLIFFKINSYVIGCVFRFLKAEMLILSPWNRMSK